MKSLSLKKPAKDQRERLVLLGLVELYLKSGKPIGSNTLRENGFDDLSSATIRNYCMKLEEEGYLKQQHSSGGRIPTHLAYQLYADTYLRQGTLGDKERQKLRSKLVRETREIAGYLQQAAEILSDEARCAVFLSAPRFDHDFILDIKLVGIDSSRCLCVMITDFGIVHTEVLYAEKKLSNFTLKRVEAYLHFRITSLDKPELTSEEEALALHFYNELMLRHIVSYTNFSAEDIYKTGFSKLLGYSDFSDASTLAHGLALFENPTDLRAFLNKCSQAGELQCWIGDDLQTINTSASACSVVATPYRINQTVVGALAILGPNRIPYRQLFGLLETVAAAISETLTKSLYKFKITFRQPKAASIDMKNHCLLLEDKTHD